MKPTAAPQPDERHGTLPAIGRTLRKFLLYEAAVSDVEELSEHYRLVGLSGDALRDRDWLPGHQIQIGVAPGLVNRTYTPISWNSERGHTQFLVYLHGDGPGCRWVRAARCGTRTLVLGPRASLDLVSLGRPGILFGDETCFGLALAWRDLPGAEAHHIFEISHRREAEDVLRALGVSNTTLIERRPDDTHLTTAETELLRHATAGSKPALAGKVPSIQHMKRALRRLGIGAAGSKTKAYWAPGKTGLD